MRYGYQLKRLDYCMGKTQGEAIEVFVLNVCAFVQGSIEFCCMP